MRAAPLEWPNLTVTELLTFGWALALAAKNGYQPNAELRLLVSLLHSTLRLSAELDTVVQRGGNHALFGLSCS